MSKKNEDSVERFFRKAVEQHDDTFMQRDWQKMEKMLDAEAAKVTVAKFQRLKKAIFRGTIVTGIVAVVYFLVLDQQHPESRLLSDALVKKQAVAGEEAPTTEPGTENPSTATLFPEIDSKKKPQRDVETGPGSNTASVTPETPHQNLNTPTRQHINTLTAQHLNTSTRQHLNTSTPDQTQPDDQVRPEIKSNNIRATSESDPIVKEVVTKEDVTGNGVISTPAEKVSTDTENKQSPYFSRWNIAVKLAPDFSTTALNRYSAPGSAFGITIGYNITSRIAMNTGVIRSFKQYEGYGSEYSPPPGYWKYKTNGIVPDEVSGNCHILEFPVNLQFQVNKNTRNRFFATAGITSYYMLDESYHYKFEQPNPGADDSWSTDEPTSYAFSIGVLAASYERQLTPNFAISIEPFLKVPFSGIGWTDIELFTTGAYVNLRYRFINRNRALESAKSN